jgi:hypothetical protein
MKPVFTSLHGVTSQNDVIFNLPEVRVVLFRFWHRAVCKQKVQAGCFAENLLGINFTKLHGVIYQ